MAGVIRDQKFPPSIEREKLEKMRLFLRRTQWLDTYLRPRNINLFFLLLFLVVIVSNVAMNATTGQQEQASTIEELLEEIRWHLEMPDTNSSAKFEQREISGWIEEERKMGRLPFSVPKPQPRKIVNGCEADDEAAKNVMFLMTHQTDASIFQNILIRYGMKNQLKFLLPIRDICCGFKYPSYFSRMLTENSAKDKVNLMAHHTRFNPKELRYFLPDDTKYISIVRDPYSLYYSTFEQFYDVLPVFGTITKTDNLIKWYENATPIYNEYLNSGSYRNRIHFAKNHMLFDFGFENNGKGMVYLERAISLIEEKFDFIMISNYMEESLIVLADVLCWPIRDFAHLSVKENSKQYEKYEPIDEKLKEKIRAWNHADALLFDHFNKTLWATLETLGKERVENQRRELRAEVARLAEKCLESGQVVVKSANWNSEEIKTNLPYSSQLDEECSRLVANEDVLADELYGGKGRKV